MNAHVPILKTYLSALGCSAYETIKGYDTHLIRATAGNKYEA